MQLIFNTSTTPSEFSGTLVSSVWTISSGISSLLRVDTNTDNQLMLYLETAGVNASTGTITNTKTYKDGTVLTESIDFKFKTPTVVIVTRVNAVLQNYLYTAEYAANESYTTDMELLPITTIAPIIGSGSTLTHLAELNYFENLEMTTLDLSNCADLGSNNTELLLEDNVTTDYVNILPRANATLAFDFEEINMAGTQLKGANLKQGSILETITYSDYTTIVKLENQTSLDEVNVPYDCLTSLDTLIIENCDNLEEITWI